MIYWGFYYIVNLVYEVIRCFYVIIDFMIIFYLFKRYSG